MFLMSVYDAEDNRFSRLLSEENECPEGTSLIGKVPLGDFIEFDPLDQFNEIPLSYWELSPEIDSFPEDYQFPESATPEMVFLARGNVQELEKIHRSVDRTRMSTSYDDMRIFNGILSRRKMRL